MWTPLLFKAGDHYKNPSDDMDEDLSDVASDYGGSNETKKHKKWQENCWQQCIL
ncbi:hypothetical protein CIRG_10352 [Coccidioides immitis RMSCC 2394]|uniref:Uncharacterized protein n=1 Tax=Coccidioides immitis RMSCC 2394 TaxID=404692 RepID=A0A0J6Y686_COCIT|nr:hypothetical protein CIRG_10352 [Coccidioides immitis RMSCC 2394]